MGFNKGVAAIKAELWCPACCEDDHGQCEYLLQIEEIGPIYDIDDLINTWIPRAKCQCFIVNSDGHVYGMTLVEAEDFAEKIRIED